MEQTEIEQREKLISDVEPIDDSAAKLPMNEEQIKEIVEEPLQDAVLDLIKEKGIRTVSTSANKNDIENGYGYIAVDYENLSQNNKRKLDKQGYKTVEYGQKDRYKVVELKFQINKNTTVEEIKKEAQKIVNKFELQEPNWIKEYSVEDVMEIFSYKPEERENFLKEAKEEKSSGYYFNQETQKFYDSKWLHDIKMKLNKKIKEITNTEINENLVHTS